MKFSVITPSFNQLDWLRLCVASVRDQPIAPHLSVEHIIQDAGTPGIEKFAQEIGALFFQGGEASEAGLGNTQADGTSHRIFIFSEKDEGMYDAVNRGIRKATGDIISYLNCDEQYLPGALNFVREIFEQSPSLDTLFLDAIVVAADGSYICDRRVLVPSRAHTLTCKNLSIFTAATFSRKRVFHEQGLYFDPAWKTAGDAVWALSLLEKGVAMRAVNRPTSSFTDTGENLDVQARGLQEKEALRQSAPLFLRWMAPIHLLCHRLRRAVHGHYFLKPHRYQIYTQESPTQRVEFLVFHPTVRWRGR